MSTLVTFLHVLVCIVLVGTVLLQQGKGGGMGGAFGGANAATVFGSGGASVFLRRLTAIAATMFMLTSMTLAWIASNDAGDALKSFSSQQAQLKKRKKEAEDRALKEQPGAGIGTGATDTGDTGPVDLTDPSGAAVDDGDTGEDETGVEGAAVPSEVTEPATAPTAPSAAPTDTAPAGTKVQGAAATPGKPAPSAPAEKPAAEKPAPTKPAPKKAAPKPAAEKPATETPAADEPAAPAPAPEPATP